MQDKIQAQLQERIEAFAADITAILQDAVAEAVQESLGSVSINVPSSKARRRGRAPAKAAPAPAPVRRRRRKKGQKRTAEELEALTVSLHKEIKRKGGRRIEQIAESMGVSTKELALPVKKLMAGKQLKTKGQRRGMTYSAR